MGLYTKVRTRITIGTVLVSLSIIVGLWTLLFVTDYVLHRNNMPMLFSATSVNEQHVTIEKGLGYYVITNTDNLSEFYLFGHRIK